jgi:tripartite-type tricarboxylate transporter receptor subunit TctC
VDELGVRLDPMTPEQFTEFVRRENAKYQKVAKDTGIRME